MDIGKTELLGVLRRYNPWWGGTAPADLPSWRRAAFGKVVRWMIEPPAHRALLLSGARQVGKTTLLLQTIEFLLQTGVPAANILYATLDHPMLKAAGLDSLLDAWRDREPALGGTTYLFLDEIQYAADWQTWLKLQVDFQKDRRIAVTGSATPLLTQGQESGVGRWHNIALATLSFSEYLGIRRVAVPALPRVSSLDPLFDWSESERARVGLESIPLVGHFHEYLLRGGFPQTALVESLSRAQHLLREDILEKMLKRDMTALFGVRRVLELEQLFLYLCTHDSGMLDISALCKTMEATKPTVHGFLNLLEAAHLIHRLRPHGQGKQILRAGYKVYLADASIAPAVLLKGKSLLEDPAALGTAVETAVFNHILSSFGGSNGSLSYWRGGTRQEEVDFIAEINGRPVPFEVKYRGHLIDVGELKGMAAFCAEKKVARGYVITREPTDFAIVPLDEAGERVALKMPAPLACYWLGLSEAE